MTKQKLIGNLQVPGDKSISHRALIFASFAKGVCQIEGLSPAEDCQSTINCLQKLGLKIKRTNTGAVSSIIINSPGIAELNPPNDILFVGNSGTSIRLLSGLVSGLPFHSTFDGDESIRKRPMSRVLDHLERMGARVSYKARHGLAPFTVYGSNLTGHTFTLKVSSAQVQTALLLAGLQASGRTTVHLPGTVRDHTTRMFAHIGIPFETDYQSVSVEKLLEPIRGYNYQVPGDISSAAFFMVAAACTPGSKLVLTNVGLNVGRTLVIDVLKRMGASISFLNASIYANEPVADIEITGNDRLHGVDITAEEVSSGVDELPVLALAGALCNGSFSVRGAEELRHKESDRLQLICSNLHAAGVEITEFDDGFTIVGKKHINGGSIWKTALDHRLAMSGLVADLLFENPLQIEETNSTAISYPSFARDLKSLVY